MDVIMLESVPDRIRVIGLPDGPAREGKWPSPATVVYQDLFGTLQVRLSRPGQKWVGTGVALRDALDRAWRPGWRLKGGTNCQWLTSPVGQSYTPEEFRSIVSFVFRCAVE
jgi:hypothetical protein